MRDDPHVMMKFVKIVKRHPEVYDSTVDSYKMRVPQNIAWAKIANCVKTELQEECTADELKLKWKGIRSSFTRFLSKLRGAGGSRPCKKYYLYDSLRFLDPFVNLKGAPETSSLQQSLTENDISVECSGYEDEDIKPEIDFEPDKDDSNTFIDENQEIGPEDVIDNDDCMPRAAKQRRIDKEEEEEVRNFDDENDLMLFFRSIVPDLKHFTAKEKRRFKMGILGLVDVIEDERRKGKNCDVVSST